MKRKQKIPIELICDLLTAAALLAAGISENAGSTGQELMEGLALARLSALRLAAEQSGKRKPVLR